MWWLVILWLIAGVLTMINKDEQSLRISYIITWIVLMTQLINNYILT
jgi:hypothetical protein